MDQEIISTDYEVLALLKEAFTIGGILPDGPQSNPNFLEQRNVKRKQAPNIVDEQNRMHRGHLNESEITQLLVSAQTGLYGIQDHCMFLLMYRHGLRVSETWLSTPSPAVCRLSA